jgi:hypothetical protein
MQRLWHCVLPLSLLLSASYLTAQATVPKTPQPQGSTLPAYDDDSGGRGQKRPPTQDSNIPPHTGSDEYVPISRSLQDMSDLLALLISNESLESLIAYEDQKFDDPSQKLRHRKQALIAAIKSMKAACK